MACNNNCKLCKNIVISDGVSVVAIEGVNTLVINVPSQSFANGQQICLVVAQIIPSTATITMPVAISIGGDTTTVYPMVKCNCTQVTACAIRTRTRYPLKISTTSTSAVFKVLRGLSCSPSNALQSIPAPAATTPAVPTT